MRAGECTGIGVHTMTSCTDTVPTLGGGPRRSGEFYLHQRRGAGGGGGGQRQKKKVVYPKSTSNFGAPLINFIFFPRSLFLM